MSRPTEIIIDLLALKHNLQLARSLSGEGEVMAVVKADAYGHGATDIAKALQGDVSMFAVSCLEEAQELRDSGITNRLLLLEGCFSAAEYNLAARLKCDLVIHNQQQADDLLGYPGTYKFIAWLKVDTGMHRLGVEPSIASEIFKQLESSEKVQEVLLMTHLSCADELNNDFTDKQVAVFRDVLTGIELERQKPIRTSIANSAGILAHPASSTDWSRPGIMLYGLSPFSHAHNTADKLKPVMTFRSRIIALREIQKGEAVGYGNTWHAKRPSVIATIAVGYGDGYPRAAKSGTPLMVNEQRATLVGNVSMDMICADVTDLQGVKIGDPVELWGARLSANEVAKWASTIGYELVTRMPKRTKRVLRDNQPEL